MYEKIEKADTNRKNLIDLPKETFHVINPDWMSEAKHSHIPNLVNLPSASIHNKYCRADSAA
jgi:hypothetical protein